MTAAISAIGDRVWLIRSLVGAGMLPVATPLKYLAMGKAARLYGLSPATTFALAALRAPTGPAVVDEQGSVTWADVMTRSTALAAEMVARVGSAPTVAVMARNSSTFIEAVVATLLCGGRAVLLNTGFGGPQLAGAVESEGAQLLIYDEEFRDLLAGVPSALPRIATNGSGEHDTVAQLIEAGSARTLAAPSSPGRMVLLTSGTSGAPKGAERGGAGNGLTAVAGFYDRIPLRASDIVVIGAPMFHAWGFAGLTLSSSRTSTVVLSRRFDPESVLKQVARHRASVLWLVPVMLERIMNLPADIRERYDLSTLRVVALSGSAVRHDAVVAFMDAYGDIVYNNYSSTEVGWAAIATPEDLRRAPGTAGKPPRGTQLRILDENGNRLPIDAVGRIFVRNDSLFEGYTAGGGKVSIDGFMETGDIGHLDAVGRLFVDGRSDDMIVSGGENVYPREVEALLTDHADVIEAAVVGVDDDQFGQRLDAYVVLADGVDAAGKSEALRNYVRETLARHKVPRHVHLLSELPRNAAGKLVKRDLRPPTDES